MRLPRSEPRACKHASSYVKKKRGKLCSKISRREWGAPFFIRRLFRSFSFKKRPRVCGRCFFCHHIVFYKSVYYSYVKNNFGSWLPASTGVWTRARRIKQRLVECQCKVSKAWSLIEQLSVLEARIGYEQTLENIIHLPDSLHSSINDSYRCLYVDQ